MRKAKTGIKNSNKANILQALEIETWTATRSQT
jgi:hypothetical protein